MTDGQAVAVVAAIILDDTANGYMESTAEELAARIVAALHSTAEQPGGGAAGDVR